MCSPPLCSPSHPIIPSFISSSLVSLPLSLAPSCPSYPILFLFFVLGSITFLLSLSCFSISFSGSITSLVSLFCFSPSFLSSIMSFLISLLLFQNLVWSWWLHYLACYWLYFLLFFLHWLLYCSYVYTYIMLLCVLTLVQNCYLKI